MHGRDEGRVRIFGPASIRKTLEIKSSRRNNNMADGDGSVNVRNGNNLVCTSCKLNVDRNSDSCQVPHDNANSSCVWDTEDVSISRLHLGL